MPPCWRRSATSARFTYRKAIGRYAGLNPTVHASGGKNRTGHIAKAGPPDLRWILQQAAWTAIRVEQHLKRMWLKIGRSAGRKAAAVAIARKMLTWMWRAVLERRAVPPSRPNRLKEETQRNLEARSRDRQLEAVFGPGPQRPDEPVNVNGRRSRRTRSLGPGP